MTERVKNVLGHGQGGSILVRRDEQYRQGWNNQDSTEIERGGGDTEEDKSRPAYSLRNLASDEGKGSNI